MLARSALTRRHAMEGSYGQWPRSEMKMLQVIEDNKSIIIQYLMQIQVVLCYKKDVRMWAKSL